MQTHIRFPVLVAAVTLAASAAPALAQSQTVKAGVIRYDAHSSTNGVTGVGIPPGADAEVGDATTLFFTYEYEVKPNVGVELVLGVPPKITAKATGSVAFLGEVLTARNVAPTLLVNYHFGDKSAALRPYLGLGINYTRFTNVKTPYAWDVKLRDSVGLAAQVGADYRIDKHWGLFGSVARVDVKSKLVATGATVLQTTIDFKPWTYSVGAFCRF
jgi:outer membrane protein